MIPSFHKTPAGRVTCLLAVEGRKFLHLVKITPTGVRVCREQLSEKKWVTPIPDYTLQRFCEKYLDAGTRLGISVAATRILTTGQATEDDFDAETDAPAAGSPSSDDAP